MTAKPKLAAIVLAGGESKRFRSSVPKVLHPLLGRPLVGYVLEELRELHRLSPLTSVVVVVPPGKMVEPVLNGARYPFPLTFAVQRRPLGTGDAAKAGLAKAGRCEDVLVLAGDAPLVHAASLGELVRQRRASEAAVALQTAVLDDPGDYGRVIRNEGKVVEIVEVADATLAQRHLKEVNTCTYAFEREALAGALPKLKKDNAQSEYYLTDVVGTLARVGAAVLGVQGSPDEALGTNTRRELAVVAQRLRRRVLDRLMDAGVTIVDPDATYVDVDVVVGPDTVLMPNTYLEGATRVGSGCEIGPNVRLRDTTVADSARVTFAVAVSAKIGPQAEVGPFASLRHGTVLRRKAKAGTFVEMKEADVGEGSKVPHQSYMGDVTIGRGSNIGAGTITCNYDGGKEKHRTTIGDDVFVGTNNSLRAPVRIGRGAYTGAGSVVTHDVKAGEMVFGVPARPQKRKTKKKKGGR